VLVRALEPVEGLSLMRRRRAARDDRALLSGPGKLCQALGIDRTFDGADLTGGRVWFEDDGFRVAPTSVAAGPRVGVASAGADALLPYRLWLKGNSFVSRKK
jgi:DNA-3-methyladenine glycosylase